MCVRTLLRPCGIARVTRDSCRWRGRSQLIVERHVCLSKGDFFQIFLECIPRREKASPRLYSAEKGRKTAKIDRHWRTRRSWTRCGSGPFRPRKTCLAQKSPACKGVTFGGNAEEAFRLTRAARRCLGGCALCKKVPELFRLRSAKAGTGSRGLAWLTGQETPGVQAPERRHASSTPALENGCRLQGGVTRARSADTGVMCVRTLLRPCGIARVTRDSCRWRGRSQLIVERHHVSRRAIFFKSF